MSDSCRVFCGGLLVFGLFFFVFLLGVRFGFEYAYPMAKLNHLVERNGQLETEVWNLNHKIERQRSILEENE